MATVSATPTPCEPSIPTWFSPALCLLSAEPRISTGTAVALPWVKQQMLFLHPFDVSLIKFAHLTNLPPKKERNNQLVDRFRQAEGTDSTLKQADLEDTVLST